MYNAIIGTGNFTKLLIQNLIDKGNCVILISNKNSLEPFKNYTSIIKKELDINNCNKVKNEVLYKNYSKIIIYAENDMITLMLAEALKDLNNVYVIFNSKSTNKFLTTKCKCIFLDEVLINCFDKEIL